MKDQFILDTLALCESNKISVRDLMGLVQVHRGHAVRPVDLSRSLRMSRPSTSNFLNKLGAKNLMDRENIPDSNTKRCVVTEEGELVVKKYYGLLDKYEQ